MPADLADDAASAVAPDEILRAQALTVGERDVDTGGVLHESGDLAAIEDRHLQLGDPAGEDALDVLLPQREPVVVAGREVADVQAGDGEAGDLRGLTRREEPVGDAALVEDFDGARGDAEGARAGELLIGPALDDGDVHSRQRQFACEHEPRRPAARDHDRMIVHRNS